MAQLLRCMRRRAATALWPFTAKLARQRRQVRLGPQAGACMRLARLGSLANSAPACPPASAAGTEHSSPHLHFASRASAQPARKGIRCGYCLHALVCVCVDGGLGRGHGTGSGSRSTTEAVSEPTQPQLYAGPRGTAEPDGVYEHSRHIMISLISHQLVLYKQRRPETGEDSHG